MPTAKPYSLLSNSRFYVLVSTVLLSIIVVAFFRLTISSDQLFYIRTQQFYGLLCIFYWYTALIISPIGYVIGKQRTKHIEFARRAIGVSAAYFAVLHAAVALWGQLGGFRGVGGLSPLFQWSLLAGLFGVVVLLLMAATSFDGVIKFMTFRRWKWLHRLVYVGGILAVLHIWSLGTHVGYGGIQLVAFVALVVLSGLEMFRLVTILARKHTSLANKRVFYSLFAGLWLVWIGLIASIPLAVENYRDVHSQHMDTESHPHESGDAH
ncbi:MAG: ferric reductase-like transmembrane domain-containing protein [Patescibacteria group bacterium]